MGEIEKEILMCWIFFLVLLMGYFGKFSYLFIESFFNKNRMFISRFFIYEIYVE